MIQGNTFLIVHQLRLKNCRILKNYQLDQKLQKRFQLNQKEQIEQIDENEYAFVEQDQDENTQLIYITLENNGATIQVNIMPNSPISKLEEYINKENDEIVYFYYKDLQLLTQFTFQQYNFLTNDVIQYRLVKKQQKGNLIQIFVKSDNHYYQLSLYDNQKLKIVQDAINERHANSENAVLLYQNSLIDLQSTAKQQGIKQGFVLQYKILLKLDQGENTFHLSIEMQDKITQQIQILQNQTPSQLINRLFNYVCVNANDNSYRLTWFTQTLQQNQALAAQGIEEGDELTIVEQQQQEESTSIVNPLSSILKLTDSNSKGEEFAQQLDKILKEGAFKNLSSKSSKIHLKSLFIIEKPRKKAKLGLIVQFQCEKSECRDKIVKMHHCFGLGKFILTQLVCQCLVCRDKNVQNKLFGVMNCEYVVIINNEILEQGLTNPLLALTVINQRSSIEGIIVITTE